MTARPGWARRPRSTCAAHSWFAPPTRPTGKASRKPATAGTIQPLRTQSARDKARVAARKKELCKDTTLVAYIDCGLQVHAAGTGQAHIQQRQGKGWTFKGTETTDHVARCHKDITFDDQNIVFEIRGLNPKQPLQLHLSWWDFNHAGRTQSVWASAPGGKAVRLHAPSKLPAWKDKQALPQTLRMDLPANVVKGGRTVVRIRREDGVNAVLGELWLTSK
jgi:hypothetical protein